MTAKIFTPYLKPLSESATTVVFKSADNQLSYLSGSTGRHCRFSKYVLLKLPDIIEPQNGKNNIQFASIEGAYTEGLSTSPGSAGDNIDLMQSMQNYALNMESLLLENPDYDMTTHQTVAERVMFKWLKEIGALRWKPNTVDKSSVATGTRYTEKDFNDGDLGGSYYDPVIKFIGEIDIQGDLHSNYGSKQQIYWYMPSHVGSTPKVLFKNVVDDNYYPSMVIKQRDGDDFEFIRGSNEDDNPSPAGLKTLAFFDLDVAAGSYAYVVNGDEANSWFDLIYDPNYVNSYLTDLVENNTTDDLIVRSKLDTSDEIIYQRSRLDCVQIDFDSANYKAFEDNANLKSFMDFNAAEGSESFEFNAVMTYYDVIENGVVLATNLYGITFLGNLLPVSGSGSKFKSLYKQKPDSILNYAGNGYGLVLNITRDGNNNVNNTVVNVSVNDYNTFSMQLFTETFLQMGDIARKFENTFNINNQLVTRMGQLEQLLIDGTDKKEILATISQLKTLVAGVGTTSQLSALIAKLYDTTNEILAGKTSVSVDILFNMRGKNGLKVDKDEATNTVYVRDEKEKYFANQIINIDVEANQANELTNSVLLTEKTMLVVHRNNATPKTMYQHVYLRINEAKYAWKTNQVVEVCLDSPIVLNNKSLYIATGITGSYEVIGTISEPIKSFQIICLDSNTRDFIIKY